MRSGGDIAATAERRETRHGWPVQWIDDYPEVLLVTCPACGHLSVRDETELEAHACPGCGFSPAWGTAP